MFARLFSKRIRDMEKVIADQVALLEGRFDDLSITGMNFDPKDGFRLCFDGSVGRLFASWAVNTLKSCGAENYVEMEMFHETGRYMLTVQRCYGESPASKAARLERELAQLKSAA